MSVTDKTGLSELARVFKELGINMLASSGTQRFLEALEIHH